MTSLALLARIGFGAAVGHSWPLSPVDCWVRLDIVSLRPSMAQQLQTRRALLELICQLSVTPSCRWEESFESLWWPAVLRPADFKDEKYLETVRDVGAAPKFALFMGKPTLEGVQMFSSCRWTLKGCWTKRTDSSLSVCSIVDGMGGLLAMGDTSEEEEEDFHRIEFEVTSLWFGNCRFLSASDALESLAEMVTLPSSTIRNLMLPGVYLNSLRNPAGLQSFQSFSRQVLAPSSPLRSLDLTRVGIDGNCMTALCSVLRYSSPLVKLSVGYTTRGAHSNSRLLWAWIFLSVFHVDSGSGLEHVDVSGLQLQAQDVEALVAMLESPHPGRILVLLQDGRLPEGEGCEECELPPERLFVRLLDGSQAWTNPGYSAAWPQLLPGTLQALWFWLGR
ncbi:hypothetical protein PF011_g10306 [Phytophthora fragariae]|uniref:Uncharacterized protein n=3 Tax=Phytophthora fragariae TaxID=53985 RepID=A0A6A3L0R1_9STRA|nr:hypothetical protein PF011_g10306 [Phytophthora fragariae]